MYTVSSAPQCAGRYITLYAPLGNGCTELTRSITLSLTRYVLGRGDKFAFAMLEAFHFVASPTGANLSSLLSSLDPALPGLT